MGYTPPQLEVRKFSGYYNIMPPSTTSTDDLYIYPNTTDAAAKIKIEGLGDIFLVTASSGALWFSDGTVRVKISYATPDTIIESLTDAKNLYLKTTGTGVVKFGTYTAGAATDSTGFITIQDAAGNTRKLMVQA